MIYCADCQFEAEDGEAGEYRAQMHRAAKNHATTHTVQPALREHHPGLFP